MGDVVDFLKLVVFSSAAVGVILDSPSFLLLGLRRALLTELLHAQIGLLCLKSSPSAAMHPSCIAALGELFKRNNSIFKSSPSAAVQLCR